MHMLNRFDNSFFDLKIPNIGADQILTATSKYRIWLNPQGVGEIFWAILSIMCKCVLSVGQTQLTLQKMK